MYSTEDLARRTGYTPAAVRFHLKKKGISPTVTDLRHPRHCRIHSWPEEALQHLQKLKAATVTRPAPNPIIWASTSQARAVCGFSRSQFYRLCHQHSITIARRLVAAGGGPRWRSFIPWKDVERLKKLRQRGPASAPSSLLLHTWQACNCIERSQGKKCMATLDRDWASLTFTLDGEIIGSCEEQHLNNWISRLLADSYAPTPTSKTLAAFARARAYHQRHANTITCLNRDSISFFEIAEGYPHRHTYHLTQGNA